MGDAPGGVARLRRSAAGRVCMTERRREQVVAATDSLVGPSCFVLDAVVVSAEWGEVGGVGSALRAHGMRWSMSDSAAGIRHPGWMQQGFRVSTSRRCWAVGLLRVVPAARGRPVSASSTTQRHSPSRCLSATWRAMSATTGPYPASSPGGLASFVSDSRLVCMTLVPRPPLAVTPVPSRRSSSTSARSWSIVRVSPGRRSD